MNIIRLFLTVFLLFLLLTSKAQTYISPITGVGTLEATTYANIPKAYQFYGASYFNRYYLTKGISISHQLSDYFLLELAGNYSEQLFLMADKGFAGYSDLKFNNYRISMNGIIRLADILEIGVGFNHQIQTNHVIGQVTSKYQRFPFFNKKHRFQTTPSHNDFSLNGYNVSIGCHIENFVFRVQYINPSLNQRIEELELISYSHLELLLLYRFQISKN